MLLLLNETRPNIIGDSRVGGTGILTLDQWAGKRLDLRPGLAVSGHHENWRFFGEMEWYLTCRQISHAADILNAYCQFVLADVIEVDHEVWGAVSSIFPKKSRDRYAAVELLRKQDARDMKSIGELFRDELRVFWNPQIDLIVTLRNKIVHQNGFDHEGEVANAIARCAESKTLIPPVEFLDDEIPAGIDDSCRLIIDARTGLWWISWPWELRMSDAF